MNEYDVKKALSKRSGQSNNAPAASQSVNGIPNSVLTDVFAGKRRATSEMMGHREELAPSIAAKMSRSFGMDFSAVKVYRSDAMAGTEMHGMAQGDKVVLSRDVDLNTMEGQATLGHELSHIRAQSMGMGSGRGLLNDASLEHQADSEGMLAARGMNISGETMGMSMGLGMAGVEGLSPIGAGLSASAGAPMQALKISNSVKARSDELIGLGKYQQILAGIGEKELQYSDKDNLSNIKTREFFEDFESMSANRRRQYARYIGEQRNKTMLSLVKKHRNLKANAPAHLSDDEKQAYADYLLRRDAEEFDTLNGIQYFMDSASISLSDIDNEAGCDSGETEKQGPFFQEQNLCGQQFEEANQDSKKERDRLLSVGMLSAENAGRLRDTYARIKGLDPEELAKQDKERRQMRLQMAMEKLRKK